MVDVRPATRNDVDAIRDVARDAFHAAYDGFLGADAVDETVDRWYHPEEVAADVTGDALFYVAERDGDVVGFAHAAERPDEVGVAELHRLYVRPDDWGTGVGSALLDRVERALDEQGVDRLRAVVYAENAVGREFYESRGFERVKEIEEETGGALRVEYVYAEPL